MITLYTAATPNGLKASIMLEEIAMPYKVVAINLAEQEQKQDWYLKLNPNGRIPTIVDSQDADFAVFESGAILIYLAEKSGKLLPSDEQKRSQVIQWLMFQMGGLGPMMGQANVFYRYMDEKIEPAIRRYQNESKRLLTVLDKQLEHQNYLVGDYSIADIANYTWAKTHRWSGVAVDDLPHLQAWIERIAERPAVKRGENVPTPPIAAEDLVKGAKRIVSD